MTHAILAKKSASAPAAKAKSATQAAPGNLRIGEPNDAFEREADRVADQVMTMSQGKLHWSLPKMSSGLPLQRKCSCGNPGSGGECGERRDMQLQRRSSGQQSANKTNAIAPPIVQEVLNSSGRPLDAATRNFMEPRFGHDFSQVRVHSDARAAKSARSVDALAYTVGKDVVFGEGQFSPSLNRGKHLLAHELAHVVQQDGARADRGGIDIGNRDSRPELGAKEAADSAPSSWTSRVEAKGRFLLQRADDPGKPSPTGSRPLSEREKTAASFVFGKSLNLGPIIVTESSVMSIGGYYRTLPNTIYIPPGELNTIPLHTVIHELTHCWQYQHGVSVIRTGGYAIKGNYNYNGRQGLLDAIRNKKCFKDFGNTEQQAQIVEDYSVLCEKGENTYPWEVFIDQVRNGNCNWPKSPVDPPPNKPPSNTGRA